MPQLLQGQICKNAQASNDVDRFPITFLKDRMCIKSIMQISVAFSTDINFLCCNFIFLVLFFKTLSTDFCAKYYVNLEKKIVL